jgi:hypothetical protein
VDARCGHYCVAYRIARSIRLGRTRFIDDRQMDDEGASPAGLVAARLDAPAVHLPQPPRERKADGEPQLPKRRCPIQCSTLPRSTAPSSKSWDS